MRIRLEEVPVRDVVKGYVDFESTGVRGYLLL